MKKTFFAGLAILLPVVLTILILMFFVNLLTDPFQPLLLHLFKTQHWFQEPWGIFKAEQVARGVAKLVILVGLVLTIVLLGLLGQFFLLRYFGHLGHSILKSIPGVNMLYNAFQEVAHNLFSPKSDAAPFSAASAVVLIPFPSPHVYTLGFVTNRTGLASSDMFTNEVSVFVPGTPNPLMGFMLVFKPEEVIKTNLPVDEAIKFVISCGVISSKRS